MIRRPAMRPGRAREISRIVAAIAVLLLVLATAALWMMTAGPQ